MTEWLPLLPPLLVGVALGTIFFGGLWWTVRHAMTSRRVALWFFASLLLRTVFVLLGFYLACGSDWRRWLAALVGFSLARLGVTWLTRPTKALAEVQHAP